ncbi:SusC/RagA family TonB-linked outer membrane protein [Sphingobacterium paludis]|uniref:TonB-linked SusC/RagA family outer membrane protein n=1 Tax=Sphingobacterium paludis TaxID=1476465 RepID=A0A4R7D646_9SPHI|nr:TonB-dependent receptor [Sphingobacterium paludis]TDS16047.1 TonB-linked SusC/RagA family outer membrane protein [Sphingobacterium paludis]
MIKKTTNPLSVCRSFRLASLVVLGAVVHQNAAFGKTTAFYAHSFYQQMVTGRVTAASGPVAGATVSVQGKASSSTATDDQGNFTIDAKLGDVLVFNAIGFEPHTQVVDGNSIQVLLTNGDQALEEVIVVGYGTQKKESLTGALTSVKGDELRDITTPSVENMLNAKAPGVYVAPGTGQPGSRGAVVIRGQATLSGTTSPLWVIDGVIIGTSPGDLNPDDVESMTVLKDAASTAIYGSQGANGVVVVTTKNAKSGKTTIDVSTKVGFNQLTNGNLEMMNGEELYDYYASFANANTIAFPRWNADLRNSNFDWWKVATKNGFTQNHNITLQGGTETVQSLLSIGLYDEQGAVRGYDFTRYNVRFRQTYKPFDWLTVKPSFVGARRGVEDREYSTTAMYSNFPWDSPFDANGNLVPHRYSGWVNSASTNYLYDLQWNNSTNTNYELMGNLDFDVKLTDWLTFSSVNNYRYNNYSSSGYIDPRSNEGESVSGRLTEYRTEFARRYTSQILRANKTFGAHALNGVLVYEFNDYSAKVLDVYGTGFIPGFQVLDVVNKPERTRGKINEWAVQSLLSNVHYAYDNRYLAQVSFRRDGASNFGDNAKYGNFFSVSAGWNMNNEEWFKADWVDALKLRAAYGSVGNRPSALYPQYNLYAVSATSGYNGNPGALINQKGNPDLTWEKTYTTGVGVDASLLNNRARVTLDYYIKNTDNILYEVPVTGTVGITSIWRNIGEMRNTGFELAIGGDIIRNDDWLWSVDLNVGHNRNRLTQLYPTKDASGNFVVRPVIVGDGLGIAGSSQRILEPGLPVDTYYLKEWAGVNPENGAPMWYKVQRDANGNETSRATTSNYSEATFEKLGNAAPNIFGGFSTALRYKAIDLNAVFGYSIGGEIYNYSRQEYDADGTYTDRNQMKLMPGWSRWEKEGDHATHPVAKYNNRDGGNQASSRFIESSDFLRLRSLTIGYTFKLDQYKVRNLRVYFAGENLFVLTKYSGVDPELSIKVDEEASLGEPVEALLGSTGPSVYPATRRFMMGLNLSF